MSQQCPPCCDFFEDAKIFVTSLNGFPPIFLLYKRLQQTIKQCLIMRQTRIANIYIYIYIYIYLSFEIYCTRELGSQHCRTYFKEQLTVQTIRKDILHQFFERLLVVLEESSLFMLSVNGEDEQETPQQAQTMLHMATPPCSKFNLVSQVFRIQLPSQLAC